MSPRRRRPHLIVVAGPNGAGKSTAAPHLLRDTLAVSEFVNADAIAAGLSAFRPESVAVTAGRIMLRRMQQLARDGADFAFETTLATRSYAPWLAELTKQGYDIQLLFLLLQSPELAVSRVAERVRVGGHDVPEEIVRRRFAKGLRNFFRLYLPLVGGWQLFDNSGATGPRLIASGTKRNAHTITDRKAWTALKETYDD